MRTLIVGIEALHRRPLALIPLTAEGVLAGCLVLLGAIPAGSPGVTASATFPLDVYFDVKQSLVVAPSWAWVIALGLASVAVRSTLLVATLRLLSDEGHDLLPAFGRAARLVAATFVILLPAAGMHFVAVGTRYAPFAWLAALLGVPPAIALARRGLALDIGGGTPSGKGPSAGAWLTYAYAVALLGAVASVLGRGGVLPAALCLFLAGPLHAVTLAGWRRRLEAGEHAAGGTAAVAATVLCLTLLFGTAFYDRTIRAPVPERGVSRPGSLLILGGVDSTTETGSLADLDPRVIGFPRGAEMLLSYREADRPYRAIDTRRDLDEVANVVAEQIAAADEPRIVYGHSQASLIVDRILMRGLESPDASIVLAPAPPVPPSATVPPAGEPGRGAPAGDFARAFAALLDNVGVPSFDIDVPASPMKVDEVVVEASSVPRLAIWALGDAVWLTGDWRRPGEANLVALTDHVGVTRNSFAVNATKEFLDGELTGDHEVSWQGFLTSMLRYAFEPWRPR